MFLTIFLATFCAFLAAGLAFALAFGLLVWCQSAPAPSAVDEAESILRGEGER